MDPRSSFLAGVVTTGMCARTRADPICLGTTFKRRWRDPERECEEGREDGGRTKAADPTWRRAGLLAKSGCGTQPRLGGGSPPGRHGWRCSLLPLPSPPRRGRPAGRGVKAALSWDAGSCPLPTARRDRGIGAPAA